MIRFCILVLFGCLTTIYSQELVFSWRSITYKDAPSNVPYIEKNNVPTGSAFYDDRVFISVPRRLLGVPSTLNWVTYDRLKSSLDPPLSSYPDYSSNVVGVDSSRIISVWRPVVDACNRLWFVDTGVQNGVNIHAPTIWAYHLRNDSLAMRYVIPTTVVPLNAADGMRSITIDVQKGNCENAFAYMPNSLDATILVYSLRTNDAWKFTHPTDFRAEPNKIPVMLNGLNYNLDNVNVVSLAVGRRDSKTKESLVYFHSLAGISEYSVRNVILQNRTLAPNLYGTEEFEYVGSRGAISQASMSVVDRYGIAYFGQVQTNSISCWDTNKPLVEHNIGFIDSSNLGLIYPSDLDIDNRKNLWVLSNNWLVNRTPSTVNLASLNYYLYRYDIRAQTRNTVCEPGVFRNDYVGGEFLEDYENDFLY